MRLPKPAGSAEAPQGRWSLRVTRRHWLAGTRALLTVAIWLALSAVAGSYLFANSSRDVVLAGHDAILRPTLDGMVQVRTGPVLPDVRVSSGRRLGVDIYLGKTDAATTGELIDRYAFIASNPDGQIAKVVASVQTMAITAAMRGGLAAAVPIVLWYLVGVRRRRELLHRLRSPVIAGSVGLLTVTSLVVWRPWELDETGLQERHQWRSVQTFLGSEVTVPPEAADLQVRVDVTTDQTRRLLLSALDTYRRSKDFYRTAAADAVLLELPQPGPDETVVVLVSDRHLNIGMDPVARAIADRAGASVVFDAGDDTSTGKSWEAFSVDSVTEAFADFDKFAVVGNHDHGEFVPTYFADKGWQVLDGELVEAPGNIALLGVGDPRSSGLGNWRDETGLSFAEVTTRIADAACAAPGGRVATVLVHDANLGDEALERGCADLVVGGHLHLRVGPDQVIGPEGQVGYSYTTGTTGGAAYAIAVGSKPRRDAQVSLITYRDGHPIALQWITVQTNGKFDVGEQTPLAPSGPQP